MAAERTRFEFGTNVLDLKTGLDGKFNWIDVGWKTGLFIGQLNDIYQLSGHQKDVFDAQVTDTVKEICHNIENKNASY